MKKLLFLLLPVMVFSQSFILSNIPLPKTYVQDLDPYECDDSCRQELLDSGMIFSFLAHAINKLPNKEQNEARVLLVSILNLGAFHSSNELHIAMLLPYKKIGKYAASTTNASFAYLMTKSHPFTLKSYKVNSESVEDLEAALQEIRKDGFEYIIAPLTKKGVNNIIEIDPALHIYFPTINKHDVDTSSAFLTFGAIDYIQQSDLLLKEALSPLVVFSDKSTTGKKLALYQKEQFLHPKVDMIETNSSSSSFFGDTISAFSLHDIEEEIIVEVEETEKNAISYFVSKRTTNLEYYLKEKEEVVYASFFINTPIIKSAMIMSQLTLYDTNATNVLSTQINYDPLLLSMTQYRDRKDMVVANSITEHNNVLIETNALLGNDIVYDWINYSTTIGVDYFYSLITDEERTYKTKLEDNQMIYDIELLQPSHSKFKKYVRPFREPRIEEFEEEILLEEAE
ncbi:Putative periplasmic protein [hydrothermal vent metagenome]|uniref:Putative periplasmic protein n=1 Tax=hydrothermal vent metagenome TaxID=652676 RepID=A0A1W1C331_9ZZZZ